MLPKEILKKVKLLEISTRKMVDNLFAGEYHTVFKGQGLTFADFREYVPGDEIRSISWNLTAKTGKPFVKRYDEERELTMMLVVDISGSGEFGSGHHLKGEVLLQLASVLAFTAAKNNDRVGLLLFSDRVEHFVAPKKGRGHVHRILRDLLFFKPQGRGTDLKLALESLNGILRKKSTVFLLSDFLAENFDRPLKLAGRRHDVVAIVVEDRAEKALPSLGLVEMQDAETGEVILVDTSSSAFRRQYEKAFRDLSQSRDRQLAKAQVDQVRVDTSQNFFDPLIKFFASRHLK
jgi:uncharacterized protein (DUF58 family)